MLRKSTKTQRLALLSGLFLLLASCGGSEESTTTSDLNPLEEALGLEKGFESSFDHESQIRTQEAVASCMKNEGFEYEAFAPNPEMFETGQDISSKEYAEEWGFGISTQMLSQKSLGPELKGHAFDLDPSQNPNTKIHATLEEEEQDAYEKALYGPSFDALQTGDFSADEEVPELEGCYGEAIDENPILAVFGELEDQIIEMDERVEADPEAAKIDAKLTECIQKTNPEVQSLDTYQEELLERLVGFFEAPGDLAEGDLSGTEEDQASGDQEVDPFEEPELTAEQKTELGEIQTEEIEVAVATFECTDGEIGEQLETLENKYLQEFVEANKETFDKHAKN